MTCAGIQPCLPCFGFVSLSLRPIDSSARPGCRWDVVVLKPSISSKDRFGESHKNIDLDWNCPWDMFPTLK